MYRYVTTSMRMLLSYSYILNDTTDIKAITELAIAIYKLNMAGIVIAITYRYVAMHASCSTIVIQRCSLFMG